MRPSKQSHPSKDSGFSSQNKPQENNSSYGQILRSSSIIGGATGVNYIIGMLRMKLVAMLLGPSGVGLVGLYISITGLVSTLAQLGIDQSGVREVAEANGSQDPHRVASIVKTLRRVCWLTGTIGWLLTVILSWPLTLWTFGSTERVWAVALLGVTVLVGAVTGGQTALLQGMRRIGDLAKIQVLSAVISTVVAVALYACLAEKGILPVIILTTIIQLGVSWYFSRRIQISHVSQSWTETATNSKRLISVGAAFMYGALLAAVVGFIIRSLIVRNLGMDAGGIYQASWALSGMFAGFILGAMGTDFYPRLTAVAHDNAQVNRLVNEQTEIGILLALPGLMATLAFAPLLMRLFYSSKFLFGAQLLPWFVVGIFAQVITYPLGFIQRAKGSARWIFVSQTHLNLLHVCLGLFMIKAFGLAAAAWAFAITSYIHGFVVFGIARHLSSFRWNSSSAFLVLSAAALIIIAFAAQIYTDGLISIGLGALITTSACIFSLRGLSSRLGASHSIVKMALRLPGGRLACGI